MAISVDECCLDFFSPIIYDWQFVCIFVFMNDSQNIIIILLQSLLLKKII